MLQRMFILRITGLICAGFAPAMAESSWELDGTLPTPIRSHGVAVINGQILVFGGYDGSNLVSDVYLYQPGGGWDAAPADLPIPLLSMGFATHEGRAYSIGGWSPNYDPGSNWGRTNEVWNYDPVLNTWDAEPSIGLQRDTNAAASLGGYVYTIGGHHEDTGHGFSLNLVDRYDGTGSWEAVAPLIQDVPPLGVGRQGLGVAVVEGKIYAIGGFSQETIGGNYNHVFGGWSEVYDPLLNTWDDSLPPMPTPRIEFAIATLGHRIYTIGGRDAGFNYTNVVEYFDLDDGQWHTDTPFPIPVTSVCAVTLNDTIYVLGGNTGPPDHYVLDTVYKLVGVLEDCNNNGIPDEQDIANCDGSPWCDDCNNNDIPDGCDIANCDGSAWCGDCNENGLLDACDIEWGDSGDCDSNGIPDECESLSAPLRIAFTGRIAATDPYDVFSMNADGSDLVNHTADFSAGATGRLAVSPDGGRIAFTTGSPNGIWVINADGTDPKLVRDAGAGGVDTPRWYNNDILFYAYTTSRSCPYSVQIRSISFDGVDWGNDVLVVANASAIGQHTTETFDISPDRSKLVWDAQQGCWSPTYDIYVCDLVGTVCTNARALYADPGDDNSDGAPKRAADSRTVYWQHWINPGVVVQPIGIAAKAIDSPRPVTEYDQLYRPDLDCGIPLVYPWILHDLSPDDTRLLFWAGSTHGVYTYDIAAQTCVPVRDADYVRDAVWTHLCSVPDECDISNCDGSPGCDDCNDNGVLDECDIASGFSSDGNANGVPDECEPIGCGTLLVQVNEHRPGGGGSTIVGIEGLQLCVFDKSPGSCVRDFGVSHRHYHEVFNYCDPVACGLTDADGSAGIMLDAGDYVIIGEYDPDGYPPNGDGDERLIGVSASDFECAPDGDPNTVTMQKHLQVIILPNGRTVGVNPRGGGGGRSAQAEWIEITNLAGPDDSITVVTLRDDVHAGMGGYAPIGAAVNVDSSLSAGEVFMTVLIPFTMDDLRNGDPLLANLTYYDSTTNRWPPAVAGNVQVSPDHEGSVIGDRFVVLDSVIPPLSDELGDYGVFWNPDVGAGFVWANVDHASDFAAGTASASIPEDIPAVSEWGLVVMVLLLLTGAKVYFNRRRGLTPQA